MARRRKPPFDVSLLRSVPAENLHLESLSSRLPRLEGYAYRFTIILPLLSESGEEIFSPEYHLPTLAELFDFRFGGCLWGATAAHPPWYGSYLPESRDQPEKDYHTIFHVYTNPIPAADLFFQYLKSILKQFQEEIVIERAPVWLMSALPLPEV